MSNLIIARRNCKPSLHDFGRYFGVPMETPHGIFPMVGICEKDGVIHLGRAHQIIHSRIVWYDWFQCTLLLKRLTPVEVTNSYGVDELRGLGFYTDGLATCIYKLI